MRLLGQVAEDTGTVIHPIRKTINFPPMVLAKALDRWHKERAELEAKDGRRGFVGQVVRLVKDYGDGGGR
jgi:hypothetical protein